MTCGQYMRMIGARLVYDSDYDLHSQDITPGKVKGLKKFGFSTSPIEGGIHIHAPMRKVKSWFDRGWDWQLGVTS